MCRVYVSGKLKDELQIRQLRNYIWVATDAEEFYRQRDPHITIVPAFNAPEEKLDIINQIIDSKNFKHSEVRIKSLSVYENIHKPYTVQLDAEYDIRSEVDQLISELQPHAESEIRNPDSPHITLFKTQGWWDTIPKENRRAIQSEIMSTVGLRDTEISRLNTEIIK